MFLQNANTNMHRMAGGKMLEHGCEDTKPIGSGGELPWVEGDKHGVFLFILCLGEVHRFFFRAICIW